MIGWTTFNFDVCNLFLIGKSMKSKTKFNQATTGNWYGLHSLVLAMIVQCLVTTWRNRYGSWSYWYAQGDGHLIIAMPPILTLTRNASTGYRLQVIPKTLTSLGLELPARPAAATATVPFGVSRLWQAVSWPQTQHDWVHMSDMSVVICCVSVIMILNYKSRNLTTQTPIPSSA